MRITGGKYRGRLIEPPSGFRARPTTDFARQGLMNVMNNRYDFESVTLLDLFGGTGAISYEFASRGTTDIDIVDTDRGNCGFIRRTVTSLGLESAKVHRLDVRDWLKICRKQYDIIFADPPYALKWLGDLPRLLLSSEAVKDSTLFILEHPASFDFKKEYGFSETRRYGNVNFSFFIYDRSLNTIKSEAGEFI